MDRYRGTEVEMASIAYFPSRSDREAFLLQLRLWNLVEGLPRIQANPVNVGEQVRLLAAPSAQRGLVRLVEAFGGIASGAAPGGAQASASEER
jgi:hypothetical protein